MLNKPDEKCLADEKNMMSDLFACIDNNKSLIFNSGAGAGKTYALIEGLKYICREKREILEYHNQKVVCITYTNVATNEIKERLGNTELVLVSTIHERLWDIIRSYQEELLLIHLENLEIQIDKLQQEIDNDRVVSSLSKEQKDEISKLLVEKQIEFYSISKLRADEFKNKFCQLFPTFSGTISNAKQFSETCAKIIRVDKYKRCITAIQNQENGYTQVKYDARSNRDYLHYMKISHDTLLLYAYKIISKYDKLKRLIADRYPYFFIDEYQDTNEVVIRIITEIADYSNEINHPIVVAYFGDSVQNIYDKGVGSQIENYCKEYLHIEKKYNRRSCYEIIELANKIRNDGIIQKSIYEDSCGGSVKVFCGTDDDIQNFINVNEEELIRTSGEKAVHCFLLMNKVVAEFTGLGHLYSWFCNTPYYKTNYDAIATELLSNDVNKLGEIPRYLYNLTEFFLLSQKEDTPLLDLLNKELFNALDIESVCEVVNCLKVIRPTTLMDMLQSLEEAKKEVKNVLNGKKSKEIVENAIDSIIGMQNFSYYSFENTVKQVLFQNDDDVDVKIEQLLKMDITTFERWYHYINMDCKEGIIYHTFHGTKGLEFDNVIMIFGDSFGMRKKTFFKNYFEEYDQDIPEEKFAEYCKARNLLYVATTRARKNLRILYTGDYKGKKETFDNIFGQVIEWDKGREGSCTREVSYVETE